MNENQPSKQKCEIVYIKTLKGHIKEVNSLVWSEKHSTLFSSSSDKTIKIWKYSKDKKKFDCV